ncbi:putative zinc metallopeptidase [Aureobasidium pullulans EXF-150]|uniref:Putative zinc metallopeptidase n=1 Tax=Aureobasidium pullulans EXF-150 TaxID=1043002 RepID=A0A074XCV5_AURPU|nr:putative zinc metallopeptidase [Aureobasidium pullulans EXF-150]KEQ83350.1 putative zinc metallopeptidase [Aureobasidium pullulans EXF-150]
MFPGGNNIRIGGPSNHQKSYPSSFQEHDSLFGSYEHLMDCPQPEEALLRLRKIASLVKPLMRKRSWKVKVLTEFLPDDQRLLGLNINKTFKICVRLRYTHNPGTFLPIEECVDTLLHELSHIIFGDHDSNFHALWDELRDDHETLVLRGYTGEGFLTGGKKLGGGPVPPQHEMRRLARANAEKRRVLQKGSGRTVGGKRVPQGADLRKILADAADRRATVDRGCASGTAQANNLAEQAGRHTFKTKAEEDDANNRAIAEALMDLMEEEEAQKMKGTFSTPSPTGGLTWSKEHGLATTGPDLTGGDAPRNEEEQLDWACQVCTCINLQTHLACDACGVERPAFMVSPAPSGTVGRKNNGQPTPAYADKREAKKETPGWHCRECGTFVEHMWWCCTLCGLMKDRS